MRYLILCSIIALAIFACGIVGWFIGATIGGNSEASFVYRGLPGYEGAGLLGAHLGVTVGVIAALVLLWLRLRRW